MPKKYKIGIDAMGGDYAPSEVISGARSSVQQDNEIEVILYGEQGPIEDVVSSETLESEGVKVVYTGESIEMSENPTRAVAQKKESSINVGMAQLAAGEIDAFVSAGNTGAMLVSSMYNIGVIEGIQRPALCTIVPKSNGGNGLLLDVGANADCKPEHLYQFAVLGKTLVENVYGIENPKVGLMSIGEEKGKGNMLTIAAHTLFEESQKINFIGNIEGRDLFSDDADVMVCDGFTGNVVLKTCEGFGSELLNRGVKDEFLDKFDFRQYGGTPILGVDKPVIVGHGISKGNTIQKMINLGLDVAKSNLIEKIKQSL